MEEDLRRDKKDIRWKNIRSATDGQEEMEEESQDKAESNSTHISSNLSVLKGPILSAWSPVIPEVTQLPDAKIVIFDLALDGARQELARRRRNLR